jgi:penicillin-binding protein 1A
MPTDIQRQIGSVAKPIWAYGPAMEHLKWGPGTMLNDDVFAFQSGMLVRNWSTRHEGRVTLRQALVPSWNPPALQAFNAVMNVDPDLVGNFVTGLGLPEERVELFESYAIGGNTTGFAPIHLAGAYAAFGNTGVYNEPRAIARIIAPDGTIYYQPPHEESFQSEQVMSEQTAYLMTDVLRSVMIGGPDITHVLGAQANVPGLYVAGKTGTTNFPVEVRQQHNIPEGGVPDVWMVGYTHEFTLAIWTGYESLTEGRFLHGATRDIANILFRQVMSRIPHEEPMRAPQRPEGIVSMAFELMSGTEIGQTCSPSAATPSAFSRSELFQAGHGPSCVSTRFSMPDAPENFRVSASGTTFEFRWDHIDDLPMTLSEAQSAVDRARGMILGSTYMTDAIRNMNPTEGQAAMMVRQIQASGETEYVVIATLSGGGTREFGPTTDNQLNVSGLSISEINNIESFHVITRFERSKQSSDPSNVVQNNIIDPSEFEVTIPNMEGFTLNQFHQWRNEHGIEAYDTSEAHSDTVPEGRIITTNPTGRMNINQRIRITVSLGPREVAEPNPNPEPTPDPNPEPTPDSSGTDDADPDDGFDPDDPLSQFIHLGFANHPVAVLPGRKDF